MVHFNFQDSANLHAVNSLMNNIFTNFKVKLYSCIYIASKLR